LINRSFSQDLFPRFPSCQFIDQFIQKADFLHQRIFDFFHPYTTSMINAVWGCNACACKKKSRKKFSFSNCLPARSFTTGQPADDLVDLFLSAVFLFNSFERTADTHREFRTEIFMSGHCYHSSK